MNTQNKANIMVFGIDRLGYRVPGKPIELKDSVLHFKEFKTEEKFQDYEGVVLFNETFEDFSDRGEFLGYLREDLLKRENQLRQLGEKKGFCCFLVWCALVHSYGQYASYEIRDTDLVKRALNSSFVYWTSLPKETTDLRIVKDEFRPFLKNFGSAQMAFYPNPDKTVNLKPICFAGTELTGFVVDNVYFLIPCLRPSTNEKGFKQYFSILAEALISSFKKLSQELPLWTAVYRFKEEEKLLAEKDQLTIRVDEINERLMTFNEYKKCLCYDDELLKESVISIFEYGFNFMVDQLDELREDMKILDKEKKPLILIEVKGTNKGVHREFINQADSHRERSGFSADFSSIVIINTNIKSAKSLKDKGQEVAKEHVAHAVKMKILVLRTIDLLNLLYLVEAGKITCEDVLELFKNQYGWLKVTQEDYRIEKGTE
jgi:hypothetical protein